MFVSLCARCILCSLDDEMTSAVAIALAVFVVVALIVAMFVLYVLRKQQRQMSDRFQLEQSQQEMNNACVCMHNGRQWVVHAQTQTAYPLANHDGTSLQYPSAMPCRFPHKITFLKEENSDSSSSSSTAMSAPLIHSPSTPTNSPTESMLVQQPSGVVLMKDQQDDNYQPPAHGSRPTQTQALMMQGTNAGNLAMSSFSADDSDVGEIYRQSALNLSQLAPPARTTHSSVASTSAPHAAAAVVPSTVAVTGDVTPKNDELSAHQSMLHSMMTGNQIRKL